MKPIIVCLDQNAISCMAVKKDIDDTWAQLYRLLLQGVEAGCLVSPVPYETQLETSLCSVERQQKINDIRDKLSCGIHFKDFNNLLIEETLAIVRPSVSPCPFEVDAVSPYKSDILKAAWIDLKKGMQSRYDADFLDRSRANMEIEQLFESISAERCGSLYRDLKSLLNGRQSCDQGIAFTDQICKGLQSANITRNEVTDLCSAIENHGWEAIPIVHYHSWLSAQWEYDCIDGRIPKANDDVDRLRTAVALNAADYFLTEKAMIETCKKVKVHNWSSTKLFSIQKEDLQSVILLIEKDIARKK